MTKFKVGDIVRIASMHQLEERCDYPLVHSPYHYPKGRSRDGRIAMTRGMTQRCGTYGRVEGIIGKVDPCIRLSFDGELSGYLWQAWMFDETYNQDDIEITMNYDEVL